ncbi:hypothetical protein [Longimicrobium sp.]|jgi:hypothetical protein|uniref:hypothetical protein n=1 Tax=Longimicrobium sp. TaxID=2029185 RepID=UPI002ED7A782
MNIPSIRTAAVIASLFALAHCSETTRPEKKGCPCLSARQDLIADTLGGLLAGIVRTGTANGFPGGFARSCDSIRYTYFTWLSIATPARPDSQITLNNPPVDVRIDRAGGSLMYEARMEGGELAKDTVPTRWIGNPAVCLPNVEKVVVDSIDARLLSLLNFPAWKLQPSVAKVSASCTTLDAELALADPSHPRKLSFGISATAHGDSLAVTASLGGQSFPLFQSGAWCQTLGVR